MYGLYLSMLGYRVELATNGHQAVVKARGIRPDLIVMDLQMPKMDGWAAIRKLRSDARTAHIPVIVLTGHDFRGVSCAFRSRGRCRVVSDEAHVPRPTRSGNRRVSREVRGKTQTTDIAHCRNRLRVGRAARTVRAAMSLFGLDSREHHPAPHRAVACAAAH